jgi:hypothetical protein
MNYYGNRVSQLERRIDASEEKFPVNVRPVIIDSNFVGGVDRTAGNFPLIMKIKNCPEMSVEKKKEIIKEEMKSGEYSATLKTAYSRNGL